MIISERVELLQGRVGRGLLAQVDEQQGAVAEAKAAALALLELRAATGLLGP